MWSNLNSEKRFAQQSLCKQEADQQRAKKMAEEAELANRIGEKLVRAERRGLQ